MVNFYKLADINNKGHINNSLKIAPLTLSFSYILSRLRIHCSLKEKLRFLARYTTLTNSSFFVFLRSFQINFSHFLTELLKETMVSKNECKMKVAFGKLIDLCCQFYSSAS